MIIWLKRPDSVALVALLEMSILISVRRCRGFFDVVWMGIKRLIILIVDVVAVVLIVRFLSWKIKHKLEEVELRQKHALHQKTSTERHFPLNQQKRTRKNETRVFKNRGFDMMYYVQSKRCHDWPIAHRSICTDGSKNDRTRLTVP